MIGVVGRGFDVTPFTVSVSKVNDSSINNLKCERMIMLLNVRLFINHELYF